jgi:hypothetical protein
MLQMPLQKIAANAISYPNFKNFLGEHSPIPPKKSRAFGTPPPPPPPPPIFGKVPATGFDTWEKYSGNFDTNWACDFVSI